MHIVFLLSLPLFAAFLALGFFPEHSLARTAAKLLPDAAGFAESVAWGLRETWNWVRAPFTGAGFSAPACPAALYLALVNVIAFVVMGVDKLLALAGGRRVPEKALFALSLIGGSLGAWAGMYCFHHKTNPVRKPHFVFGFPLILLLHIAIGYGAWNYFR